MTFELRSHIGCPQLGEPRACRTSVHDPHAYTGIHPSLKHLPISRVARSPRPAVFRSTAAARLSHSLGLVLLVLATGASAVVFGRLAVGVVAGPPAAWSVSGCVRAPVEPLGRGAVTGQAELCPADGGTAAALDLEHLEPMARYAAWVAYFEQPGLCSLAVLQYQAQANDFHQPCTLTDLDGPDPRGSVRSIRQTVAGPDGSMHLDLPPNSTADWQPRAQAWLLVGRPTPMWTGASPSAMVRTSWWPDHVDTKLFEARAIFELP